MNKSHAISCPCCGAENEKYKNDFQKNNEDYDGNHFDFDCSSCKKSFRATIHVKITYSTEKNTNIKDTEEYKSFKNGTIEAIESNTVSTKEELAILIKNKLTTPNALTKALRHDEDFVEYLEKNGLNIVH
jgi:hypothetical protein